MIMHFDTSIILPRIKGLPNILPFNALMGKKKKEKILWRDFFQEKTSKYFLIGSAKYFHLSGNVDKIYEDDNDEFAHYVLEGIVLFHDSDKNPICGGIFADYDKENFCDLNNLISDYIFKKENGKIAQTDEEKNNLVKKYIKELMKPPMKTCWESGNKFIEKFRREDLRRRREYP